MAKSQSPRSHREVSVELDNRGVQDFAPRVEPYSGRILEGCKPSWDVQRSRGTRTESGDELGFNHSTAGAWHASYGTHVSRAIMQRSGAEFMPEVVIGRDDRVRIHSTIEYPYCSICSLEITASTGRRFVGTGWLASNDTVVTAGHCVYMPDQGGWAERIRVYPGRNGVGTGTSFLGTQLKSVEGWTRAKRPATDYGAIRLNQNVPGYGSFGYVALNDRDLKRNLYHVVGYSADKPLGTLWGHIRPLSRVEKSILYYQTDTYGGNSGCPVFLADKDDQDGLYVVGIHNYGDASGNSATRITEDVFENIQEWCN